MLWYPTATAGEDPATTARDVFDHLPTAHPLASTMLRREKLSRIYAGALATPSSIPRCAGRSMRSGRRFSRARRVQSARWGTDEIP